MTLAINVTAKGLIGASLHYVEMKANMLIMDKMDVSGLKLGLKSGLKYCLEVIGGS